MTIAIIEQWNNAGLSLRTMPSEAEDNTSDATFLYFKLWFTLLSSWKFLWLNKHRFYVWAPGKEQCAMIEMAKSPPGCQEIWVQDLPWYSRIRVITRQVRVDVKGSRGRPARQWLYDVKEWTGLSLNNMRREPENHVAWRKRASLVAPTDWIVYRIQDTY